MQASRDDDGDDDLSMQASRDDDDDYDGNGNGNDDEPSTHCFFSLHTLLADTCRHEVRTLREVSHQVTLYLITSHTITSHIITSHTITSHTITSHLIPLLLSEGAPPSVPPSRCLSRCAHARCRPLLPALLVRHVRAGYAMLLTVYCIASSLSLSSPSSSSS